MTNENLQRVEIINFKNFKEKIRLTKQYDRKAKIEIVDNKYILVLRRARNDKMQRLQ